MWESQVEYTLFVKEVAQCVCCAASIALHESSTLCVELRFPCKPLWCFDSFKPRACCYVRRPSVHSFCGDFQWFPWILSNDKVNSDQKRLPVTSFCRDFRQHHWILSNDKLNPYQTRLPVNKFSKSTSANNDSARCPWIPSLTLSANGFRSPNFERKFHVRPMWCNTPIQKSSLLQQCVTDHGGLKLVQMRS